MEERAALKKSLETISKDFIYTENLEINALSKVDCEIILEITSILKKLGANEDLLTIVNNYKSSSDNTILDNLMKFNASFNGQKEDSIVFIELCDFIFNINCVYSITKVNSYVNNKILYCIIINETNNEKVTYANKQIKFNTEEQREIEITNFKKKIKENNKIIFL